MFRSHPCPVSRIISSHMGLICLKLSLGRVQINYHHLWKRRGATLKHGRKKPPQLLTIISKYMETIIDKLYIHYMTKDLNDVCSRNSFRNGLDRESEDFRMPDETQFSSFVHFFSESDIFQIKKKNNSLWRKEKATYTGIRSISSSCQI